MSLTNIHIGTSGWSYKGWKENFYPTGTKSADYLSYYAHHFNTTEINSTFYNTPRQSTVENWAVKVPPSFLFCAKMNRYITQLKKLNEPEEPLQRFFTAIEPIQHLCGPVLIQLPASLRFEYDKTEYFYHLLQQEYKQYRYALEGRHISWFDNDSLNLMAKYDIAFVISQSGNKFPYAEMVTSKDIYVRFHGPEALYASSYSEEMLSSYAEKFLQWVKEGHVIWAYFNNDINGYAVPNAKTLIALLENKI